MAAIFLLVLQCLHADNNGDVVAQDGPLRSAPSVMLNILFPSSNDAAIETE